MLYNIPQRSGNDSIPALSSRDGVFAVAWPQRSGAREKSVCGYGLPSDGGVRLPTRHHQPQLEDRPEAQHPNQSLPREVAQQDVRKRASPIR